MVIRKRREGMMMRQSALQFEEGRCRDQKEEEGKDTEERKKN